MRRARSTFSLDAVRVEHRALGPRTPVILRLPRPVAARAMYAQLPGRGRFASQDYVAWLEMAGLCLRQQRVPKFRGPVWIAIIQEEGASIDDRAAAVLDLLLREGVIESTGRVRELRLAFGNVTGARVEIRPARSS